jgi:predicted nuclease of predicted toxin-antitoxin system
MIKLYADENFEFPVVKRLREKGYDVLTTRDAGNDNQRIPDEDVLDFAISQNRAVITLNYNHFKNLHKQVKTHCGIIICSRNDDWDIFADRIDISLRDEESIEGKLIRINRPVK